MKDQRIVNPRTSLSHPLLIATLPIGAGAVGVTFCPGKQGDSVFGAPWARDVGLDLDVIQTWGAAAVVTLVEGHELISLGVPDLGERIVKRGLQWHHLPIADLNPPGPGFDAGWPAVAAQLRRLVGDGGRVLVHCRGGLGRAGTVAACLLVELGEAPDDAVRRVRAARPHAIETAAQERYIRDYRPRTGPHRHLNRGNRMDWFERITGFREDGYEATRARLSVVDGQLHSRNSARTCAIGQLETPSLAELRQRAAGLVSGHGPTRVSCVQGDVRRMHADRGNAGALFQVASQFNLLEMVSDAVTPEHGVTRYETDATQGPACAIAAGAGTIYRNYFAPVRGESGQRVDRQIDCLSDIGTALGNDESRLWQMRNGYCLTTDEGLASIDQQLSSMDPAQFDELRGRLRIGVHWDVEVTDDGAGHRVSQALCSALPVSYNRIRRSANWARFATLVLEATYEATLLSAMLNMHQRGSPLVYLTRVGGGAFGNDGRWIAAAIQRAFALCRDASLDVRIVCYSTPDAATLEIARQFAVSRA